MGGGRRCFFLNNRTHRKSRMTIITRATLVAKKHETRNPVREEGRLARDMILERSQLPENFQHVNYTTTSGSACRGLDAFI